MNLVRFLVGAIFSICFYTCIINAFDAYNEGQGSLVVLNVQQKYLQQGKQISPKLLNMLKHSTHFWSFSETSRLEQFDVELCMG